MSFEPTASYTYFEMPDFFRVVKERDDAAKHGEKDGPPFRWFHEREGVRTWGLPDFEIPPYRYEEVAQNRADDGRRMPVFWVEGEKKVDALRALGFVATCPANGAADPLKSDYLAVLGERIVFILPDNDEPGRKHAERVSDLVRGYDGLPVVIDLPGLPDKGDIVDWLAAGHTRDELLDLCIAEQEAARRRASADGVGVSLAELRHSTRPLPRMLVEGGLLVAKQYLLLAGEAGIGKSALTFNLALALAQGSDFLGCKVLNGPHRVLLLGSEHSNEEARERMESMAKAAGMSERDFDLLPIYFERVLDDEDGPPIIGSPRLKALIERIEPAVVVLDPVTDFIAEGFENNSADSWKEKVKLPLMRLNLATGAAFVLVDHFRKLRDREDRTAERTWGTVAKKNGATTALELRFGADGGWRELVFRKVKHGKDERTGREPLQLVYEGDSGLFRLPHKGEAAPEPMTEQMREVLAALKALVSRDRPAWPRDSKEAAIEDIVTVYLQRQGKDSEDRGKRETARRAVRRAFEAGHLVRTGEGVYGLP